MGGISFVRRGVGPRALLVLGALALFSGACASGGHGTNHPAATTRATPTSDSTDPIRDFVQAHDSSTPAYATAVENMVARCMKAKGWVYVPEVNTTQGRVFGPGDGPTGAAPLMAYRKAHGYGYLTMAPARPDDEATGRAAADENGAYAKRLNPDERARYAGALGTGPDERDQGQPGNVGGCRNDAESAERKVIPPLPPAVAEELRSRGVAINASPDYVAAEKQWSTCMTAAGFSFAKVQDAQGSISDIFAAPPQDPAAYGRAATLELRTARADAGCSKDTVWPVRNKLGSAVVQDVIDKYGRDICGKSC